MMNNYTTASIKRRWHKVLLIVLVLLVLVAVGATFTIRKVYHDNLKPVGGPEKSQTITIPLGSTPTQIADILHEAGVIRSDWAFEWYIRHSGLRESLQAGTYALRPSQSVEEIATILTQGKIQTDLVTILPGKRLDQIRDDLINQGFDADKVDAALEPSNYSNHPALVDKPRNASLEGYLYPESFQKTAETKPETIVKASLDEMHKRLTPDLRRSMTKRGLTIHEGIILASMIEKEAGNEKDKPTIAQVFLKRLDDGMRLESDPTAIYGAILDDVALPENAGEAAGAAIAHKSAYNTYAIDGLMPGPISNVTESSLQAVANPAKSDYLFFVAGNDCVTRFSRTVNEHDGLKAKHGIGCKP